MYLPFRCVGHVTHDIGAFVFRFGKEGYVATSIGRSFHVYDTKKLHLKGASPTSSRRISAICAIGETVFTGHGSAIKVWHRFKPVKELKGHTAPITFLLLVGSVLVSVDKDNMLRVWDAESLEALSSEALHLGRSQVTSIMHPSTYVNKIVVGMDNGEVSIWNIKTQKLLHTFRSLGSRVRCLEQSPVLDVVAAGLSDGRIVVFNLKTGDTLMTLRHAQGSVTGIAFRSDSSGEATMVSGDTLGMIVVWNLEKQRMVSILKNAHKNGGVASVAFMSGEPLLVTCGTSDNALKIWIFDQEDGSARMLRERTGHYAPPRVIQFASADTIVTGGSEGSVRKVCIIQEQRSVEMSQKPLKKATNAMYKHLPAVVGLYYNETRRREWSSLLTIHAGMNSAWLWKDKLNGHPLVSPTDKSGWKSCCITHCGNFAVLGSGSGVLSKFNVQSGLHRDSVIAHVGSVEGVGTDILESVAVTCGLDGFLRFWALNDLQLLHAIDVGTPLSHLVLHREGNLVAVAGDDWVIRVYDIESKSLVRAFRGHKNQITAITFSADARWILSASSDCSIRTWDIVSAHCIDGFVCPSPAVALAFSPENDLIATVHSDDVGIFLWSNRAHFTQLYFRPFTDADMVKLALPSAFADDNDFFVAEPSKSIEQAESGKDNSSSTWAFLEKFPTATKQSGLLSQSGFPETKFMSIIHVEDVKRRNQPAQRPTQPVRAPFALPTVAGTKLQFAVPEQEKKGESHVLQGSVFGAQGPLSQLLRDGSASLDWTPLFTHLREASPSTIDVDIRLLSLEKDYLELRLFFKFLFWLLESRQNFDLAQGYIHTFVVAHGEVLIAQPHLKELLHTLSEALQKTWNDVQELLQRNISLCSLLTKIEGL